MLTTDPSLRTDRALAAALTKIRSGALAAAQRLLAVAEAGPLGELQHARVDLVRAELAYVTSRGSDAARLLLKAAKRLEPIAPDLARATYLDALTAAEFAGRLAASGGSLVEVARAVSAMPPKAPGAADLFLYGLAANISQGYAAGSPILRDAVRAFGDALPEQHDLHAMPLAVVGAAHLFDDAASDMISDRWAGLCRQAGALSELPLALNGRAIVLLAFGELADAASLVEEVQTAAAATGVNVGPFAAMALAAFRGDEAEASALIEATVREAPLRGEGANLCAADWATAVLNNGLGRYQKALGGAQRASEDGSDMFFSHWALAEFVEAAARTGTSETAARAFRRLTDMAGASGTNWALGMEARSRALLSDSDEAEGLYREAIERLGRTRVRIDLARAHLVYGEWLRRANRRVDSREQLRTAEQMLTEMGARGFAGRAERELLATGQRVRKRTVETRDDLTVQEAQIARLAREGISNADIAARLFISRGTVEYHLHKVFSKLGISSRHQLEHALPPEPSAAARP
jgi:DNA-binding CsgD family transcriptional regulator